jgi:hypothetical protein
MPLDDTENCTARKEKAEAGIYASAFSFDTRLILKEWKRRGLLDFAGQPPQ